MDKRSQGKSVRRSTRLLQNRMCRPISEPIHIDLEGDGRQMIVYNKAENEKKTKGWRT